MKWVEILKTQSSERKTQSSDQKKSGEYKWDGREKNLIGKMHQVGALVGIDCQSEGLEQPMRW